jgi:hypothetical protein
MAGRRKENREGIRTGDIERQRGAVTSGYDSVRY